MALRDDSRPYPLKLDATLGQTRVRADGTVTSLVTLSALDLQLSLSGSSLEQLFPLLNIATPASNAYAVEGHLVHSADTWRYDNLSGRIGKSDIAGSVQIVTGGKRPVLVADLVSRVLDISDLGPMIGAKPAAVRPADGRVLPEIPFKTDRWDSVDADVKLTARALRHPASVPLEDLVTHMKLKDSVLTLDPLAFGYAGGRLDAVVSLDGRSRPINARAQVRARKIQIAKLMPGFKLSKSGIGQINGEFDLAGKGDSVRQMLATSNGKLGLVIANGEISKLMMETAGLHLWEILELKLGGDRPVKVRCGVADFDVTKGVMQAQALVFDTAVTTILGTGTIDLAQETLDLTLNQKTKNTSPLSLRSPIYVRGSLAKPQVGVNKGQVAVRALGAIALGVVNPLLALVPLVDPGPGQDSDCRQLVRDARAVPRPGARAAPDRR
jgi:AsmA protein